MTSKKKQPKCMNINNYFKIEKIFKKDFEVYDSFQVQNQDSEKVYFEGRMKECNKFIEDTFKKNKFLYCKLDFVVPVYKETVSYDRAAPYQEYHRDFEKYVKLFLFRRIGVMSIVNLIINGNYFDWDEINYNDSCLKQILFEFNEEMIYEYNTFEEYTNSRDKNYKLINGMCNNFKKLQFLE